LPLPKGRGIKSSPRTFTATGLILQLFTVPVPSKAPIGNAQVVALHLTLGQLGLSLTLSSALFELGAEEPIPKQYGAATGKRGAKTGNEP
jgi:hypothetical protein